jgi:hypothetical protein
MVPAFKVDGKYKCAAQTYQISQISPGYMGIVHMETAILRRF